MILRDAWGIPTIRGGSLLEVAREQGRVTAQDRTWQLEVERRRTEGTCAEVFGPSALEWDVLARRSLLVDTARRAYAALSAGSRAFVEAYVAGVNEVIERPWRPWTPLAVFAVQHLLFSTYPSKLWRHHLAATVAPEGRQWLDLLRTEGLPGGSNAVAVSGELTASGLPIVAGDPHRVIEAPGCYAQVRLVCTDPADPFDVAGLSFVGVPGIQHFGHAVGRTGAVAWGVTNAVADDEDVYVEELLRHGGAVIARGTGGWEPVGRTVETIRVRTGDDHYDAVPVEVLVTERGPVVVGGPDEAGPSFSLRNPSYVRGELGFDTLVPLLRARSGDDVLAAFEHWVGPVDNLLVADTAGHVEHRVVGRVPLRDAAGVWTGWVADLPRRTGPLLVTANDRATPDFARIGGDFAPPHRAARLTELASGLAAQGPITPAALAATLADDRQTAGEPLLEMAGRLLDLTPAATALQQRLLAWDRRMTAASVEATLFAAVRAAVVEAFVASPQLVGFDTSPYGDLYVPWFDLRGRIRLALPALLAAHKPFGIDPLQAVAAALEEVAAAPDPLPWGAAHVAVPLTPHQQFGLPASSGEEVPLVALSGDDDCVLAARALGGTGACVHGPVARFVWDLAGESRWVVPLGASGNPASAHHRDQQSTWAAGGTVPLERPSPEERRR